jgi:hypothetical protein
VLPEQETCDGADDDCDGKTDDGVTNACGTCGPVPVEECDAIDNDCDGSTDEDFPGLGTSCSEGVGECAAAGSWVCNGTEDGIECTAVAGSSEPESCDGKDNDCDGSTDEDFPALGSGCTEGLGECLATGSWVCNVPGDGVVCDAVPGTPAPSESCDYLDDNCDGLTDETFTDLGDTCTAGQGICKSTGTVVCATDGSGTECDAVPGPADPAEDCDDNLDNDCNGLVNDTCVCVGSETQGCYTGPDGTEGVGLCGGGTQTCSGGSWGDCTGDTTPDTELCDGLDNDCDGATDETFPDLGTICVEGVGECAYAGHWVCKGDLSGIECDAVPGEPTGELCDGYDNDCDGSTDEDFPGLDKTCSSGLGECAATGWWGCSGDGLFGAVRCQGQRLRRVDGRGLPRAGRDLRRRRGGVRGERQLDLRGGRRRARVRRGAGGELPGELRREGQRLRRVDGRGLRRRRALRRQGSVQLRGRVRRGLRLRRHGVRVHARSVPGVFTV